MLSLPVELYEYRMFLFMLMTAKSIYGSAENVGYQYCMPFHFLLGNGSFRSNLKEHLAPMILIIEMYENSV